MVDIATVDKVEAGGHTIRVGHTEDGSAWEAGVVDESSEVNAAPGTPLFMRSILQQVQDDSDGDPVGPIVEAPHKWVAVGFAIEAYEWAEVGEGTVPVEDAYDEVVGVVDAEEVIEELQEGL